MTPTPIRDRRKGVWATALAAALVLTPLSATPALAAPAPVELPDVIPAIDGWQSKPGAAFEVRPHARVATSDAALRGTADITAAELATVVPGAIASSHARAGDIDLRVNASRDDLGEEGYELTVSNRITIEAATPTGVFYGTRTVLQMLSQQTTLPRGSVIDIPEYEERGVTVCACVINISTEWIDRLIEEMGYLKLNTIVMEMKLKVDGYPQTNTWSYYTKDDVRAFVAKAEQYGIEVVPEINSPGHMEIWLENMPEMQLTQPNGTKDEVRMDITKDASYEFYTDLIAEYSDVFTSDWWHMGVDEYMLHSGYGNFPQVKQFAQANWGPTATEDDVVAWYVNKVNAYVKSEGKKLRIWNDGVIRDNQHVDFDRDITIEHWNNAASTVAPQTFVDWGHDITNVTNSLYMVRGSYGVNSANLYNTGWTPEKFYNGNVTTGTDKIRGARMSIWPDGGTPAEAENTTEARMFEPLRFVAQSTWAATRPWETYAEFKTLMDEIGRTPLWENAVRQPVPNGTYAVGVAAGSLAAGSGNAVALAAEGAQLTFAKTADGYYKITDEAGRCLDLARTGTMRLSVPVEIGADITFAACANNTLQKWQVRQVDGGFTIVNAASQQHLSVSAGLVDVPVAGKPNKNVADGRVVQTPADWGQTVWSFVGDVTVSVDAATVVGGQGEAVVVEATVANFSPAALDGGTLRLAGLPAGWTAEPAEITVGDLGVGASATGEFELTNTSASGIGSATVEFVSANGVVAATAPLSLTGICTTQTISPAAVVASSQQTSGEPAPNGPAAAAIDGNPATYWHSQWSPTTASYPHSIVVDLGAEQTVCGLAYTPRASTGSGGANGRIADYDVYTSTTLATVAGEWGAPVASGTFANTADVQLAAFASHEARYVKLVARSEVNGNPWAAVGELAAVGVSR